MHSYLNERPNDLDGVPTTQPELRRKVWTYIADNLLLGASEDFTDTTSLLEAGILDSTGAMELIAFIEETFAIRINDDEIVPDNLDSVERICALIARKQA